MGHAILSPSAAYRWTVCTPSARLEAGMPDITSEFAAEGTLAHEAAASLLTDDEMPAGVTPEMLGYVWSYADHVLAAHGEARKRNRDAVLAVETRIDLTKYVPGGYGTADAVIIADDVMDVIDLKYGKGVRVDAFHNKQMMLYALGALEHFGTLYDIRRVRMTIVQPRLDNICTYEEEAAELMTWGAGELREQATQAYRGEGAQVPGAHCMFCKARAQCRALAEAGQAVLHEHPDPALLTVREMADVLPLLPVLKNWLGAFEEYTLSQALQGTEIPGYKVVEGRSVRQYGNTDAVARMLLSAGYGEEQIYAPRALLGITAMEKTIGKKTLSELLAGLIVKPRGKPALVPESDKRPAYNDAASDFANIE